MGNFLFAVHIIAIVAAFGPTLVFAMLGREAGQIEGANGARVAGVPLWILSRITLPALIVAALAGMALAGHDRYDFGSPWISASFAIVIALLGIGWFVLRPAMARYVNALEAGSGSVDTARSARTTVAIATGLFHLGFVVIVVLMIWKPGS